MKDNKYYDVLLKKILNETLEDKANEVMEKLKFNKPGSSFDYVEEGQMCECGSPMVEGECVECGYKDKGEMLEIGSDELEIGKRYKYNPKKNDEFGRKEMEYRGKTNYGTGSEHHHFRDGDFGALLGDNDLKDFQDIDIDELAERLIGKQKNIDKNHNDRIDREDFKILRGKKEMKENRGECMECGSPMIEGECVECGYKSGEMIEKLYGNQKRIDKNHNGKIDGEDFKILRKESNEVYYRLQNDNDSEIFTEGEIVELIEQIVMEEKDNIKKGKTPAGLAAYEKAHKGSGKENNDYMKEFTKKITDYNKDGSKEKFTTEPKHFPKGNGELEKMEKKAYEVSKDGDEFIDDYLRPAMQTLDYDEMHPNEEWMEDTIEGSSRTGNNQEWANAEQTEVNKNINKTRKKGAYNKAKRAAYNKAPQPVISDKPGQESGKGLNLKNESVDGKTQMKLNEEFDRMKSLMGYKQKTQ